MEHLLIRGGDEFLAFARGRIKVMRATGLKYASKAFMIDGVSISARISGDQSFISLSAKKRVGSDGKRWRRGNLSVVIGYVLAAAERAVAAAEKARILASASTCVVSSDGTITDGSCQFTQDACGSALAGSKLTRLYGMVADASARAALAHYSTGLASDAMRNALAVAEVTSTLATASLGAPTRADATAARSAAASAHKAHVLTTAGKEKASTAVTETAGLAAIGAAVIVAAGVGSGSTYPTFSMAPHTALNTGATSFDTAADLADTLATAVVALYEPDSVLLATAPTAALNAAAAALAGKDAGTAASVPAATSLALSKTTYEGFAANQYMSIPWVAELVSRGGTTTAEAATHSAAIIQPGGGAASPAERPAEALENARVANAAVAAAVLASKTALPVDLSADVLRAAYDLTTLVDGVAHAEELPGDTRYAVWSVAQAGVTAKEAFNKASAGARRLGIDLPDGFFKDYAALVALAAKAAYTDAEVITLCYSAIVSDLAGAQAALSAAQDVADVSQERAVEAASLIPTLRAQADELAELIAVVPEDDAALVAGYATLAGDAADALGVAIAASAAFIPQAMAKAVLFPPIYAQYLDAKSIADAAGA